MTDEEFGDVLKRLQDMTEEERDKIRKESDWWNPKVNVCDPEEHEHGWRYGMLWDHLGDAMGDWYYLADDWIKKDIEIKQLKDRIKGLEEALPPLVSEIRAIVDGEFGGDWADHFGSLFDLFEETRKIIKGKR